MKRAHPHEITYEYGEGPWPLQEHEGKMLQTWRYDAAGRPIELIRSTDGRCLERPLWAYDARGRQTLFELYYDKPVPNDRLSRQWQYDARGLPMHLQFTTERKCPGRFFGALSTLRISAISEVDLPASSQIESIYRA